MKIAKRCTLWGALVPWGRDLLTAAFAALHDAERVRVRHMDEGLEAVAPYASTDDGEGSANGP